MVTTLTAIQIGDQQKRRASPKRRKGLPKLLPTSIAIMVPGVNSAGPTRSSETATASAMAGLAGP